MKRSLSESPIGVHEYKLFNEESRFKMVIRWMDYIGKEFMIYNIDNKHQCFNENPPRIVRYFEGVDYFYGCTVCGRYHFCYSNNHTCYTITNQLPSYDIDNNSILHKKNGLDIIKQDNINCNNIPVCAYSGKSITNMYNEMIGNYKDTIQFISDIQYNDFDVHVARKVSTKTKSNTPSLVYNRSMVSSGTKDKQQQPSLLTTTLANNTTSKRINILENIVLTNNTKNKNTLSKKEIRQIDKQDMNRYFRKNETNYSTPLNSHTISSENIYKKTDIPYDDDEGDSNQYNNNEGNVVFDKIDYYDCDEEDDEYEEYENEIDDYDNDNDNDDIEGKGEGWSMDTDSPQNNTVDYDGKTTIRNIITKNSNRQSGNDNNNDMLDEIDDMFDMNDDIILDVNEYDDDDGIDDILLENIEMMDDNVLRMKNHNNNAYWDRYYTFLLDKKIDSFQSNKNNTRNQNNNISMLYRFNNNNNNNSTASMTEEDSMDSSLICKSEIDEDEDDEKTEEKKMNNEFQTYIYNKNDKDTFKFDKSKLNTFHINEISTEIRRIVNILLQISMEHRNKKKYDSSSSEDESNDSSDDKDKLLPQDGTKEYEQLVDKLTKYYHKVIVNIIILVYHSPYIYKLASNKHEKHEKQGKSSYSSKITVSVTNISSLLAASESSNNNNNNGSEDDDNNSINQQPGNDDNKSNPINYQNVHELICPKKICASLMLQLFTDMFYLDDSMTNHIHVWVKDPWLTYMKRYHIFDKIIVDYNIINDPLNNPNTLSSSSNSSTSLNLNMNKKRKIHVGGNNHKNHRSYENLFFKKDLTTNSSIIRTALISYGCLPIWLNSMIYNNNDNVNYNTM